ncbi:hypothetical protein XEUV315_23030, partial [Xanthomonas euvesicatoria]
IDQKQRANTRLGKRPCQKAAESTTTHNGDTFAAQHLDIGILAASMHPRVVSALNASTHCGSRMETRSDEGGRSRLRWPEPLRGIFNADAFDFRADIHRVAVDLTAKQHRKH